MEPRDQINTPMTNNTADFPKHRTEVQQRVIPFDRIANFRDLGGYRTKDGRKIPWRTLFRSGHLAQVSRNDHSLLSKLDIKTVIDFRSDHEVSREPDQIPMQKQVQVIRLPIQENGFPPVETEVREMVKTKSLDGRDPEEFMLKLYSQFADQFVDQYRKFIHHILDTDQFPILWHCSAGKDRAGFASALFLKLIGVPEDQIIEDYLLSQDYVRPLRSQLWFLFLVRGKKTVRFIQKMNNVEAAWLEMTFSTITDTWGTFDNYTKEGLQLTRSDIHHLQDKILK